MPSERARKHVSEAIDSVWDRVVREIQSESTTEIARLTAELVREQEKAKKLLEDIATLKAKNAKQNKAVDLPPIPKQTTEDDQNWQRKFQTVDIKYSALKLEFTKAKDLLRKRTDSRKEWIEYAEKLEAYFRRKHKGLELGPRPGQEDVSRGANSQAPLQLPSDTSFLAISDPPAEPQAENGRVPSSRDKQDQLPSDTRKGGAPDITPLPPLVQGSAEAIPPPAIQPEPSSDSPVVISHRVIRKCQPEETAEARMQRIKAEVLSSSPAPAPQAGSYETVEDLDNSLHLVTPRKRNVANHLPITEPTSPTRNGPARLLETSTKSEPSPRARTPTPVNSPPPAQVNTNQRVTANTLANNAMGPFKAPAPLSRTPAKLHPLKEVNPNKSMRSAGYSTPTAAPMQLKRSIRSFDEDDLPGISSDVDSLYDKRRPGQFLNTPRHAAGSKGLSLSEPKPLQKQGRMTDVRKLFPGLSHDRYQAPVSDKEMSPTKSNLAPTKRRRTGGHAQDKQGALRDKLESELRLDDFKVNPKANSGHTFAFSEVVRRRDERARLPGCTDKNCCGKDFRAMALAEGVPRTPAQKAEGVLLMQEYLGDAAYRIAGLSPDERDELWLDAKTWQLANRFGKHRHRFHRAASPPGFWNADFPTTQEIEDERRQAQQRERETVMERYREAMRSGGRWMFRDE